MIYLKVMGLGMSATQAEKQELKTYKREEAETREKNRQGKLYLSKDSCLFKLELFFPWSGKSGIANIRFASVFQLSET